MMTYLLYKALYDLKVSGGAVRVMFLDFSNAFNTIKPFLPKERQRTWGWTSS